MKDNMKDETDKLVKDESPKELVQEMLDYETEIYKIKELVNKGRWSQGRAAKYYRAKDAWVRGLDEFHKYDMETFNDFKGRSKMLAKDLTWDEFKDLRLTVVVKDK